MTRQLQPIFDRLLAGHSISREEVAALHSAIKPPTEKPVIPPKLHAPSRLDKNSFSNSELLLMSYGNNPRANAYRELLQLRSHVTLMSEGEIMQAVSNAVEYIRHIAFHIDADEYNGRHIHHYMTQALSHLDPIKQLSSNHQAISVEGPEHG
ncbi:hypothetical protein UXN85_20640 [Enterobacter hormaechei]